MREIEFFGTDEQEAVDEAARELGVSPETVRYQVLEVKKKGLFTKGGVKIAVQVADDAGASRIDTRRNVSRPHEPQPEGSRGSRKAIVGEVTGFINGMIERMGLNGAARVTANAEDKIHCDIGSHDSSLLIGKMGKTLDAIQLLANIVLQNKSHDHLKVIVDCEGYRERRQRKLIDFAEEVADNVRRTRSSRLLEPMNPYERRLVHTALTHYDDIETVSEGDGLYKQIRIKFRGRR